MATTPPTPDESSALAVPAADVQGNDPFRSVSPIHHRFSNFDSQFFALGPNASPAQAKRALQAHLAETDRRMEEAGKLGTALVQQRKELTERLKDVEQLQAEGELSDELREKLVEIERDYNEVARESARAFLPKQRVPSNEAAAGSPYVPEGKGGRRSVSPSKFEAQATGSPAKLGVSNRKTRNQPANRIHDIEFAAEISTSLITQVRNLQGLLAEKDEELREVKVSNSKLEYEVEEYQQRFKTLDDSERRYKDENWNLETQIQDLMAKEREAADREKKLTQKFNIIQAEKNAAQRELDEIKLSHSKLIEEHAATVKHHDIELGTAKRNMVMGESERAAMQRKIEDLTGQNQELAKAVSASVRGRKLERESILGMSDEDFQTAHDHTTPEQSPPPSPIKSTPRHSMLESETLKTSLAHAQRTIQSLRTNVHREKTEKMENRRLLQEARDELERLRSDPLVSNRRARKTDSIGFKKPPRLLGGFRSARSEIFVDDPSWEDQPDIAPHARSSPISRETTIFEPVVEHTDHFETANETSDAAFETANERATETDDFHTGAEEFSSDDVETETDSPSKRRTLRGKPPNLSFGPQRSGSIDSTASTEDEDFPFDGDSRTPTSLPPLQAKFPVRVNRGAFRRSRQASEEPIFQSSPASFANSSNRGTPQRPVQSLAAELGDFDGSDNESSMSATPSRRSIRGRAMTPPPAMPPLPKAIMVDSGMMTEPLHELSPASPPGVHGPDRPVSMSTIVSRFSTGSNYSDSGTQGLGEKLAEFPSPPTSPPKRDFTLPPELAFSTVHSHDVEPLPEPDTHGAEMTTLRAKHAEHLKNLSAENLAAQTATVEALKTQHADELARATSKLKLVHSQEIDALRSNHADAARKAAADAEAAHNQVIESLKSSHADEINRVATSAQSSHDQELESVRNTQANQLVQKESESKAAIEALRSAHAEELSRIEFNLKAASLSELEAVKAKHAEELSKFKADNEVKHSAEIAALIAAHTSQIDNVRAELSESHARELDGLKNSHADQIDQVKQSLGATHAEQLESLKASYLQQIDDAKNSIIAAHSKELESLQATHAQNLVDTREELNTAHAAEITALVNSHSKQLSDTEQSLKAIHLQALETLKAAQAKQEEESGKAKDAAHAAMLAALIESHNQQIAETKADMSVIHARELESLKASHAKQEENLGKEKDAAHATAVAAMAESHSRQLAALKAEGEATMLKEITVLKDTHAQEIEALNNQHAAAHAKELEGFKAALAKQVESSKTEGDAAHNQQIEALNAAHAEIVEAHKRDSENAQTQALEALRSSYERQINTLKGEHAALRTKELGDLTNKHFDELSALRAENEASMTQRLEELASTHSKEIEALRQETEASHSQYVEALLAEHAMNLNTLKSEHEATMTQRIQELANDHSQKMANLREEVEQAGSRELAVLSSSHAQSLDVLKAEHEANLTRKMQEIADSHAQDLENLRQQSESNHSRELAALRTNYGSDLEKIKNEHELVRQHELTELKSAHASALASLSKEHQTALDQALSDLKTEHSEALEALKAERDLGQSEALDALSTEHSKQLDKLKKESDVTLARELDALRAQHAQNLKSHGEESSATLARELDALRAQHAQNLKSHMQETSDEKKLLLASHAAELEALRKSLIVIQPDLAYSPMSSVQIEPVDLPALRSPRREAFIIPKDREPVTPQASVISGLGKRNKNATTPFIAEDDTRQSPSAVGGAETPDSQRPFKEITVNTDARPLRKLATNTSHQGSQTTLTADGLDQLMKNQHRQSQDSVTITTDRGEVVITPFDETPAGSPSTVRIRRSSIESLGSVARARHRIGEADPIAAPEPLSARRPGSSTSARTSTQNRPPLPSNHREAIEAARTTSAHGGKGTMGPPVMPASAYRTSSSRPHTPSNKQPMLPTPVRGTSTPRAGRNPGYVDVQSPTRMPIRSRQSSMSSFASEIDTRFNIRDGMGMEAAGFGPSTDPRMIQAITQTMIGEYLWKYTRKAGRGEMSENRHRRYFWVHPYTRTLYWSDRDPSTGGRAELKAKSVPIEAVRVVADDNPMPPGLHRKSLVIISPGRTVKFTCTTGQRHETWFNALSYLLLRTGNEIQNDAEDRAGNISQEDVDEFNPSIHSRPANGQRPRAPPSLSSYNSRTTRNGSPNLDVSMSIPTLTPTHEKEIPRSGTLGRLSGYWRSSTISGTFNSLRSRGHQPYDGAIYEASEVHDSAEDLRQIIEQQDRESDRLENVRACCDGKHDVGKLSHTTKRGRLPNLHAQTHTHTHPGPSATPTPVGTMRSRA
ncbi:hypothetical protein F5Y19DRAFT_401332 [Xylariaceae sp. FL1651]|nr:hypothetical protein F5Y19DRAFT_401332 [Xylariaceae sp. FL1651]